MTRPVIEPRSPGPLANTLPISGVYIYFDFVIREHDIFKKCIL